MPEETARQRREREALERKVDALQDRSSVAYENFLLGWIVEWNNAASDIERRSLLNFLRQAGTPEDVIVALRELDEIVADEIERSSSVFQVTEEDLDAAEEHTENSKIFFEAILSQTNNRVAAIASRSMLTVPEAVRATTQGISLDVDTVVDQIVAGNINSFRTEINTSVYSFLNSWHIQKAVAENPNVSFLYAGPRDFKNRPFCAERAGAVFSIKEIAAMDNGQGLPVGESLGGYNCRHRWIATGPKFRDRF